MSSLSELTKKERTKELHPGKFRYLGPGTNIIERIFLSSHFIKKKKKGERLTTDDLQFIPVSHSDEVAFYHDMGYLSSDRISILNADETMLKNLFTKDDINVIENNINEITNTPKKIILNFLDRLKSGDIKGMLKALAPDLSFIHLAPTEKDKERNDRLGRVGIYAAILAKRLSELVKIKTGFDIDIVTTKGSYDVSAKTLREVGKKFMEYTDEIKKSLKNPKRKGRSQILYDKYTEFLKAWKEKVGDFPLGLENINDKAFNELFENIDPFTTRHQYTKLDLHHILLNTKSKFDEEARELEKSIEREEFMERLVSDLFDAKPKEDYQIENYIIGLASELDLKDDQIEDIEKFVKGIKNNYSPDNERKLIIILGQYMSDNEGEKEQPEKPEQLVLPWERSGKKEQPGKPEQQAQPSPAQPGKPEQQAQPSPAQPEQPEQQAQPTPTPEPKQEPVEQAKDEPTPIPVETLEKFEEETKKAFTPVALTKQYKYNIVSAASDIVKPDTLDDKIISAKLWSNIHYNPNYSGIKENNRNKLYKNNVLNERLRFAGSLKHLFETTDVRIPSKRVTVVNQRPSFFMEHNIKNFVFL